LPRFRVDQFRDLFKEEPRRERPSAQEAAPPKESEEKKPGTKQVEVILDGIRQRLSLVPVGVDVNSHIISPDGKWLLVTASAEGQINLYTYPMDELSREPAVARQITSTPGFKSNIQFSPDSKEVFYIEQGRINVVPLDTRAPRPIAVSAEMDVDFSVEKMIVFRQAWGYLNDYFYDPNFHGVNWQAVRAEYEPRVVAARTPDEMRRVLSLMIGELNASHCGVNAPFGGGGQPGVGKLGVRFDRAEYETSGKLKITEVIPFGPAAIAGIKAGEYLISVEGMGIDARANLDEMLAYKVGRRVALTVSSADGANRREAVVRPVSTGAEKGLLYRKWVEERREYVAKASNGKLGYVHMPDMSSNSLSQLYVDLDVENHSREGVVIDIRNNNGGFVNAYALDVFARRGYMNMTRRGGFPTAPARSSLGQRALELPTILVINQHSLSDAEDFTEGYRALKLGKVVGEPTAGWIIYTSAATLIDGTGLRLPFIKITGADGKLMELAPRPVDIAVQRPIGESYTNRDSQLDTAVRELLRQIGARGQQ
jgi:C-terminal processing protease CtpA/Prc